jgi:osmotically-inducible protein OsmY
MMMRQGVLVFFLTLCSAAGVADPPRVATSATNQVPDARIESAILAKFAQQRLFGLQTIRVRSEHGVVYLSGPLSTQDAQKIAMQLAMATDGVAAVFNKLTLGAQ